MGYFIGFRIDPEPYLELLGMIGSHAVEPENLHVTVLHLGELSNSLEAHIWAREAAFRYAAFEAVSGPIISLPYVLCLEVFPREPFQRLKEFLQANAFRDLVDAYPTMRPHVTLVPTPRRSITATPVSPYGRRNSFSRVLGKLYQPRRFDTLCVFESAGGHLAVEASYPMLGEVVQ